MMKLLTLADAEAAAQAAAEFIAAEARAAGAARGRVVMAGSGGRTPGFKLKAVARKHVPWPEVYVRAQVDEAASPRLGTLILYNLTHLRESLLEHAPLKAEQVLAMPVESPDLDAAAAVYAESLRAIAGTPPVLDLIHLGLGPDGHTASLVPGDAVLSVTDRDVAPTGLYQDRRRMTLTYPMLNRARRVLWLVTGGDKAEMLQRLLAGDQTIPAGRVSADRALALASK